MDCRVMAEKVCLVSRILHRTDEQEDNYARDILNEQLANNWDGLTREVEDICRRSGLPNACYKDVDREEVMDAMVTLSTEELKKEMTGLSKLEFMKNEDLRTRQTYISALSLEDARLEFRWQTGILDNRANMGRRYSGKTCPHC